VHSCRDDEHSSFAQDLHAAALHAAASHTNDRRDDANKMQSTRTWLPFRGKKTHTSLKPKTSSNRLLQSPLRCLHYTHTHTQTEAPCQWSTAGTQNNRHKHQTRHPQNASWQRCTTRCRLHHRPQGEAAESPAPPTQSRLKSD